jgi:soluble lytic murein transglycosylase-like protein
MKKRLFAGILASAVLGAAFTIPAEASCRDKGTCAYKQSFTKSSKTKSAAAHKVSRTKTAKVSRSKTGKYASANSRKRVKASFGTGQQISLRKSSRGSSNALAIAPASPSHGNVVAIIKSMAPAHGVPTWFALRIAHVESNYNPRLRGAAGEYGVFQMKCQTARGLGFSGNCGALLDARTNVQWGLRHLAVAIGKSNGNLKLAASKHNGGLGRKSLIPRYVAKVF